MAGVEEDWLGARNYCRQRCMDSVSVETSPENEWVKQRIVSDKVSANKIPVLRKIPKTNEEHFKIIWSKVQQTLPKKTVNYFYYIFYRLPFIFGLFFC